MHESSDHRVPRRFAACVAVLLCLTASAMGCGRSTGDSAEATRAPGPTTLEGNAIVTRLVDGDTIIVERAGHPGTEERVRLIGIDTPETKKPNTAVECFGAEASAHLHELLTEGTPVRLERDAEERDTYDRLLAYVYRADTGLFVNEAMAADGFAGALTIPPNVAHTETFRAATAAARRDRKGLWQACAGPHDPG